MMLFKRRPKRSRCEKKQALQSLADEVKGLVLAHAFVIVKASGFNINVNKLDGVPRTALVIDASRTVNVEVVDGIVKRSWFD